MRQIPWCGVLLGWLIALGVATGVLVASTGPLLARLGTATAGPDTGVAVAAAALAWVVLAWLALGVVVGLLESLASSLHRPGAVRTDGLGLLAPAFVRRAVRVSLRAGLVAAAVGSAVVGPASAQTVPNLSAGAVRPVDDVDPIHWPVLDRPADPSQPGSTPPTAHATRTPTPPAAAASYRVRAGDSLWSIAADHLPRGASPAEVSRAWPRWWSANRQVVGDDPDLIRPGQVLRVPGTAS